nr:hypothetical protein Iba_chr13aCG8860 [Ipomoea batatas]
MCRSDATVVSGREPPCRSDATVISGREPPPSRLFCQSDATVDAALPLPPLSHDSVHRLRSHSDDAPPPPLCRPQASSASTASLRQFGSRFAAPR